MKFLRTKYMRNLCKEKGWDYDKLVHNEWFVKAVNRSQRKLDKIIKQTTDEILKGRKTRGVFQEMSLDKHGGHVVFSFFKLDLQAFGKGPIIKPYSVEIKK